MPGDSPHQLTVATSNLLVTLDSLVVAVMVATSEYEHDPVSIARISIARDCLSKLQAALWDLLVQLDKVITEGGRNG